MTKGFYGIEVEQGQIAVKGVLPFLVTERALMFVIVCKTKNPHATFSGTEVHLFAGDSTVRAEGSDKATTVRFHLPNKGEWETVAEINAYEVRISFARTMSRQELQGFPSWWLKEAPLCTKCHKVIGDAEDGCWAHDLAPNNIIQCLMRSVARLDNEVESLLAEMRRKDERIEGSLNSLKTLHELHEKKVAQCYELEDKLDELRDQYERETQRCQELEAELNRIHYEQVRGQA